MALRGIRHDSPVDRHSIAARKLAEEADARIQSYMVDLVAAGDEKTSDKLRGCILGLEAYKRDVLTPPEPETE